MILKNMNHKRVKHRASKIHNQCSKSTVVIKSTYAWDTEFAAALQVQEARLKRRKAILWTLRGGKSHSGRNDDKKEGWFEELH